MRRAFGCRETNLTETNTRPRSLPAALRNDSVHGRGAFGNGRKRAVWSTMAHSRGTDDSSMSDTSGGAAANAGIFFQHRITAYVLAHVLAGGKALEALGLQEDWEITDVRCESAAEIDDLELTSPAGSVLVQAKRTLQLSDQMDSELSSVLGQFVRQHSRATGRDERYVLATSPRSSRRITQDLRKLTEAKRLNESGADANPLTRSEAEVLQKTRSLIGAHFGAAGVSGFTERDVDEVFSKIHVVVLHLEPGEAHEIIATAVLESRGVTDASRLWHLLLELSLSLAKDRLSIDRQGLESRYGAYLLDEKSEYASSKNARALRMQLRGRLSAARDVILMRFGAMPEFRAFQEQGEYDYQVFEFFRFDADGSKRLTFVADLCQLSSGPAGVVLRRTATYAGMERYLEESPELAASKFVFMAANYSVDPEEQPAARLHSEYLARRLAASTDFLQCLQCGDPISEAKAALVEIDEYGRESDVGLVHSRCVKPAHRILGGVDSDLFRTHALLQDFDFEGWVAAARNGQGFFGATAALTNGPTPIFWVSDYHQLSRGGWCIRLNLADGSAQYATERGRVTRKSAAQAIESAAMMNEALVSLRARRDPQCYTERLAGFMPYSKAIQMTGDSTQCIEVVNAEPVRHTRSIARTYAVSEQFYAPLALLMSEETGEPIAIEDCVFLISNPFQLGALIDNWKLAGWQPPKFTVTFLRSDDEFDKFVSRMRSAGVGVIVDPLLDRNGELLRGFVIEDYHAAVASGAPTPQDDDPPRALLMIKEEADGSFTHTYLSESTGERLIAKGCRPPDCRCLGCRMVDLRHDDGTPVVDHRRGRASAKKELLLPIFAGEELILELLDADIPSGVDAPR